MSGAGISSDSAAVVLVAACGVTGARLETVLADSEGGGRIRVLAAAACVERLNWPKRDAARLFRVNLKRLTPSGLEIARVAGEQIRAVAEIIRAHGLQPEGVAA